MQGILKKNKIKLLAIILSFIMVFSSVTCAYAIEVKVAITSIEDVINKTSQYQMKNIKDPGNGTYSGEWTVIGVARSDAKVPDEYFEKYYTNLKEKLEESNGVLHNRKYTEYSRAVIALTAIGKNPANIGGYNLLEKLADFDNLVWQGINGAIWGLIALDSGNYDIPSVEGIEKITTRQNLIDHILELEISSGGWSMGEAKADPDVTAMALQSLAKYKEQPKVKEAIERALIVLSEAQNGEGGFECWGTKNSESAAQVLVALCALGIDPKADERFIKESGSWIISNLIDNFYIPQTGGFKHIANMDIDGMATDQGLYAMVAYDRFLKGKTSLYDMSDVEKKYSEEEKQEQETVKHVKHVKNDIKNKFTDIEKSMEKEAIISLASKDIINGMTDTQFKPEDKITRAQFATIISKALCLEELKTDVFSDVKDNEWFSGYVGAARSMNIIDGYTDKTFKPDKYITRQEAALMVMRAAKTLGINTAMTKTEPIDILCQFTDYVKISEWSMDAMAVCVKYGYIPDEEMKIYPSRDATREEIAGMIYRMLQK